MAVETFKPLSDALASLTFNRAKREKEAPPKKEEPKIQLALELWPDQVRGVPNAALRGSLFSIAQERTIAKKRELLSSVGGIEIRFKGEKFNQTDLDVLEMLLHYGRKKPLESCVEFTGNQLLTDLERGLGGQDHEQLKEEIARLMGGVVEITWKKEKKTFSGTLVKNVYRDEETQQYVVIFDEKMLSLYEDGYTYVDWQQRRALGKNNLAKWLHGFYASHADPFPYKVLTIKTLCGSTTKRLGDFRKALRNALDELKKIGAIRDWQIDEQSDLVTVMKTPVAQAIAGKKKVSAG
ncbi:plasmid replication initiator TrfA [Glaciimonas sp. GNP009]